MQLYKKVFNLYVWQDELLNLDAIKYRKNLIYSVPASSGKTTVAEILIYRELLCRKKNVLFVLPSVYMVQEKVRDLLPFALDLQFSVEEYSDTKGIFPPRSRPHKHVVYIAIIEKALTLVNNLINLKRINEIGLVVVDELHWIGEFKIGPALEILLTEIIAINEDIQIIGMSTVIGNLDELAAFLNAQIYVKDLSLKTLKEFIKCGSNIYEINRNGKHKKKRLTYVRSIEFKCSKSVAKNDPDNIGGLLMEIVPNGSCLIFCATRKKCESLASILCDVINRSILEHKKQERHKLLLALSNEGILCPILRLTIPYGIAYYHSGLTSRERQMIETSFRTGVLCCICCTFAFATTVKLSANRVILHSSHIHGNIIPFVKYKQMSERAGHIGFGEPAGEIILLCKQTHLNKVVNLLFSPMEKIESQLYNNNAYGLCNLILNCISLGIATTHRNLLKITGSTLLALQKKEKKIKLKRSTDNEIRKLIKKNAIELTFDEQSSSEVENTSLMYISISSNCIPKDLELVSTKLSKAAIKGGFDFKTAQLLYKDLDQATTCLILLSPLHLLYLITPYDLVGTLEPYLPPNNTLFSDLITKERRTLIMLGLHDLDNLKTNRKERVLKRFHLTLLLCDLWKGKSIFEVSEKYRVRRGILQSLLLSTASFASNVSSFCEDFEEFSYFKSLLRQTGQRLQYNIELELKPLMDLPTVEVNIALQLYKAGFNIKKIANSNHVVLMNSLNFLSYKIARTLVLGAKMILLERSENLWEETLLLLEDADINLSD